MLTYKYSFLFARRTSEILILHTLGKNDQKSSAEFKQLFFENQAKYAYSILINIIWFNFQKSCLNSVDDFW